MLTLKTSGNGLKAHERELRRTSSYGTTGGQGGMIGRNEIGCFIDRINASAGIEKPVVKHGGNSTTNNPNRDHNHAVSPVRKTGQRKRKAPRIQTAKGGANERPTPP